MRLPSDAHGICFERELLYPWHPWSRRQVFFHEVIDKKDAAVFRCSLFGQALHRWLDVRPSGQHELAHHD